MKYLKNSILLLLILMLLSTLNAHFVFASDVDGSSNIADSSSISVTPAITKVDVNVKDVSTKTPSNLLMDVNTGEILYAKNAYEKMYPASTTKLMTAILVLENCQLDEIVTVSHNAVFSIPDGYSHASLKEGEQLTVEQLLNVLLIPSANDAAVALAEHVAGSVDNFSKMMNNKAKDFGCINTHFLNPNGIHDDNHYSCAYDLALIGAQAMKFPDIMRIAAVNQYTLPATNKYDKTDRIFNLTNGLMLKNEDFYYEYATGLKTGYTDVAGSCIVATAKKDGRNLLSVILGADSGEDRYEDCHNLFEYGFNEYSNRVIYHAGDVMQTIEIQNATRETRNLDLIVKEDFSILLRNSLDIDSLEPVIEINKDIRAPISENQIVGKLTYTINDKTYSANLVAASNVISSSFETFLFRTLLIFLILYAIYLILKFTGKVKPILKKDSLDYSSDSNTSDGSNTYKIESLKSKKRKNDSNATHHGSGKFKFTQIHDYL